jgi:hypothetical protein
MSTGPTPPPQAPPRCAACGLPAAGACRLCGRPFCPAHGSLTRLLCRTHWWLLLAIYVAVALGGAAAWWFFFRE